MVRKLLAAAIAASFVALTASCSSGSDPAPTPGTANVTLSGAST